MRTACSENVVDKKSEPRPRGLARLGSGGIRCPCGPISELHHTNRPAVRPGRPAVDPVCGCGRGRDWVRMSKLFYDDDFNAHFSHYKLRSVIFLQRFNVSQKQHLLMNPSNRIVLKDASNYLQDLNDQKLKSSTNNDEDLAKDAEGRFPSFSF